MIARALPLLGIARRMVGLALLAFAFPSLTFAAATRAPDIREILELSAAASDPERAAQTIPKMRQLLGGGLDRPYALFVRNALLGAMITTRAPTRDLLAAADTLYPLLGEDLRGRMMFYGQMTEALVQRGERLERAFAYANQALEICPPGDEYAQLRAACQGLLGKVQIERGDFDGAIASLTQAVQVAHDSQSVLLQLGRAHERKGTQDFAIDAYVRSLAVFPGADTSAAAPLRKLYAGRHGSLNGLDERVSTARSASRKRVALDAHRHEAPARPWKLPDFDGKHVQLSDFKGKLLVMDFWGSWCGPCRAELPHIQTLYERYKDRGVAFVGVNWEKESTKEGRYQAAKRFMDTNGFSFPVVLDHEDRVVNDYTIQAFPTVYLIDRTGHIRYRIVGFNEAIEHVLSAQIESLME